ncbi:hypothetical protein [Chromobacterium sp. CV08]|uniref:hypothetical protein n=1 Tax=Chromobacterium sp. CV08 TaxID=3133274 RepID=UPI003DA8A26A
MNKLLVFLILMATSALAVAGELPKYNHGVLGTMGAEPFIYIGVDLPDGDGFVLYPAPSGEGVDQAGIDALIPYLGQRVRFTVKEERSTYIRGRAMILKDIEVLPAR